MSILDFTLLSREKSGINKEISSPILAGGVQYIMPSGEVYPGSSGHARSMRLSLPVTPASSGLQPA